jgi:UDP-N-acetylmuramyl pentapeptide phosphotransferase/UDP-N-acetylglucosamine-1-phosphate transferase
MRQAVRSLCAAAAGAAAARLGLRAARGLARASAGTGTVLDEERWTRTNHRGEPVTLLEGPVYAAAAAAGVLAAPALPGRVRAAGVLAALGAGAFGVYDDLYGNADRRGIRGHLTALARGELTTGGVKLAGIGALGVLGGALARRGGSGVDKALAAVVVAGAANAVNLLDLRPGRAVKGAAAAAAPGLVRRALAGGDDQASAGAGAAGPAAVLAGAGLGAAFALLPEDLGESAMLGDAGANALGALLGTAAAVGARSTAGLAWRAAAVTAVNLASEKVSFTKVIAGCPPLNAVDLWGRRPAAAARVPAQGTADSGAVRDDGAGDEAGRDERGSDGEDRSTTGPDPRG